MRGLDMRLMLNNLGPKILGCHEDFTPEAVGVFLPGLAPTRGKPKHSTQAAQLQTCRPISLSGSRGIPRLVKMPSHRPAQVMFSHGYLDTG